MSTQSAIVVAIVIALLILSYWVKRKSKPDK